MIFPLLSLGIPLGKTPNVNVSISMCVYIFIKASELLVSSLGFSFVHTFHRLVIV
jgi:dipeptide/tripeptide permease